MSDNRMSAAFMCGSMAGFSANDAIMKLIGPEYGLSQSIFLRGALLCLLFGTYAWARGTFRRLPESRDRKIMAVRSLSEIGISACFVTAVFNMPIANATAILQFVPLAIGVAAHLTGRRRAGPMRWLAILCGFVGVLIIIRPGTEGFNAYSLLALAAVFFVVLRDFASQSLSPNANSLLVTLVSATVVTAAFGAPHVFGNPWTPVTATDLALFVLAAVFLFAGYYFGVVTMRIGDAFSVAPFRYSIMVFSVTFGWVLFNEIPDAWTILGIGILAGTGVFVIRREQSALAG